MRRAQDGAAAPGARTRAPGAILRRVATIVALVMLLLAVGVLGTVGWIGSERAIHPKVAIYAWGLRTYPNLKPQDVTIVSQTSGIVVTQANRAFPILMMMVVPTQRATVASNWFEMPNNGQSELIPPSGSSTP